MKMNALTIKIYAALSSVTLIAIWIFIPQLGKILWPITILNALLCGALYRKFATIRDTK